MKKEHQPHPEAVQAQQELLLKLWEQLPSEQQASLALQLVEAVRAGKWGEWLQEALDVQQPEQQPKQQEADPRTQPKTMLRWSVNLADTMQDVSVLIVVGYDRAGMPYSWDGTFKAFTEETVYTGVMPAIQNLMLAARGVGLGTCLTTVANIFEVKMKEALGVPDSVHLVALLPLGHPTRPFTPRKRIPWQENVHYDRW